MPCPEKFKETLLESSIPKDVVARINEGFEETCSSSHKKERANYFKRATDILCEECDINVVHSLYEKNACCLHGAREKNSKEFAKKYAHLLFRERIEHIFEAPNMGSAILESDRIIRVNAVSYKTGETYSCACSNFNKSGYTESVRRDYCYCCAGHFLHHYQIMLGIKLRVLEIVSSPLDSAGAMPCVMKFEIL